MFEFKINLIQRFTLCFLETVYFFRTSFGLLCPCWSNSSKQTFAFVDSKIVYPFLTDIFSRIGKVYPLLVFC